MSIGWCWFVGPERPTSPHSIAQRTRIVLLAADGLSNNLVADKVGCNQATVVKWRKRFIERGLDGLPDDPRPGTPRSRTSPLMRRIGRRVISPSSVGRIWRAFGLKPWLTDTVKLSG